MKKELFDRIVAYVTTLKPVHSHTVKEDFESYCFKFHDASDTITALKADLARGMNPETLARTYNGTTNMYVTLLYNHVKDSISLSEFETGWNYAGKKGRWYPVNRNKPIACYSKSLYMFHFKTRKPRIMMVISPQMWGTPWRHIFQMMMGIDYVSNLVVPARHAFGTKDEWEIVHNVTGVKVPKALKVFPPTEVYDLIKVLRNPNELSSLCMHIAKHGLKNATNVYNEQMDLYSALGSNATNVYNEQMDLYSALGSMMLETSINGWLIRDYINDLVALKRKMSLKMTSKTRIEDEHRKMTKERMIKGIKAIKVAERYKTLFKDSDIEAELIETKERLLAESIDQDHCVATYGNHINAGTCAIFCITWEGVKYTLQVNSYFNNVQFRGHRNTDVPKECVEKVNAKLQYYRDTDTSGIIPEMHKKTHMLADDLPF